MFVKTLHEVETALFIQAVVSQVQLPHMRQFDALLEG